MNKRFLKRILTFLAIAIVLTAAGCGEQTGPVTENGAGNENTNTNDNTATPGPIADTVFLWKWCPFECDGKCQDDPCGPPPVTPPPPDPPTECNQANIISWLEKDKTFETLIADGKLEVTFDEGTNTLDLKGEIHGDAGSIHRFYALLRAHFLGRKPAVKTGDPCILTIRHSGI